MVLIEKRLAQLKKLLWIVLAMCGVSIALLLSGTSSAYASEAYAVYTPTQEFDSYTVTVTEIVHEKDEQTGRITMKTENSVLADRVTLSDAVDKANGYFKRLSENKKDTERESYSEFKMDNWRVLGDSQGFRHYYKYTQDFREIILDAKVEIKGNGASTGILTFIRSDEQHADKSVGTVTSVSGESYTGTIYAGFESTVENKRPSWSNEHAKEITSVSFHDRIAPQTCYEWFEQFNNCTSFENLPLLDTSNVKNMYAMFLGCDTVNNLDLSNFDTSQVTNMSDMFYSCDTINELDLSSFDTSQVTDMSRMFNFSDNLERILVGLKWSTTNVIPLENNARYMFVRDYKLVGANGTKYTDNKETWGVEYARIDGGDRAPGYFTLKTTDVSISAGEIAPLPPQGYTGKAIEPNPEITFNGRTLVVGTDYELAYKNNTNVGTATVTVTGKGNFTGICEINFEITPASITQASLNKTSFVFNGKVQKPSVTSVKVGNLSLGASDYTVKYSNAKPTNAGMYTVTITGKGNYTNSIVKTFTITKATNTLKASGKNAGSYSHTTKHEIKKSKAYTISNAVGTVTFKKATTKYPNLVVKSTGDITIKKGAAKGTFKLPVEITAAGNGNYKALTKKVTVTITIK